MTPYQKFSTIFEKWFRLTAISIGHNILDNNFKVTAHTISIVLLIIALLIFSFYTMLAFDSETAWKSTTLLSLALQVIFNIPNSSNTIIIN